MNVLEKDPFVRRAFIVAEALAWFAASGVAASMVGFGLAAAVLTAGAVALMAVLLRKRYGCAPVPALENPPRSVVLWCVLAATVNVGVLLPNDINNTDAAKHVATVEYATYYKTLLIPGFYLGRGTKYDGWTFVQAAISQSTGLSPHVVIRYSKVVLLPLFLVALYALVRLFNLSSIHLMAAVVLALLFSGDSLRLISMGGPRSWAYAFQIAGSAALLAFLKFPDSLSLPRMCGVLLGAGALMHLFFAFTNAVILTLGTVTALYLGRGRNWRPVFVLGLTFALVAGPYIYIKSGSIPQPEQPLSPGAAPRLEVPPSSAGVVPERLTVQRLISDEWGEYASLVPLLAVPILWSVRRRPREEVALYCVLFAIPCVAMLAPPVYRALVERIADSRLERLIPLSHAVVAMLAYAATVWTMGPGASRQARPVGIAVAAACGLVLVPSTKATWDWYQLVYPTAMAERTSEYPYIGMGALLLLGLDENNWPPILATSAPLAARLASASNRPIAFYHQGQRRWALRRGSRLDKDQAPIPFEFVVFDAGHAAPVYASCSRELYSGNGLTLCATRYGAASWANPDE